MYTKQVIEHFTNPHNYGKMKSADGVGKAGNPVCGDIMKVYIKVDKRKKIIKNIKFETLGCAAAIAISSMMTDLAKGKTLDEAVKITSKDIANGLSGLPPVKMHCSNLATHALREAINDYKNNISKSH